MRGKLRLASRALAEEAGRDLLARGAVGHLGTVGPDGQPYVVPVFYLYDGCELYFHCAAQGHKLDNIAANPRVCFEVSEWDGILDRGGSACQAGAAYRSVVVFGRARVLCDDEEKVRILRLLSARYGVTRPLDVRQVAACTVVAVNVELVTAKGCPPC